MELVYFHYRLLLLLLLTVSVIVEITVGVALEKYYRFERKKIKGGYGVRKLAGWLTRQLYLILIQNYRSWGPIKFKSIYW